MTDKKQSLNRVSFSANTVIFDEGEAADWAYLIRSGEVEIRKGVRTEYPQRMAVREKGDIIGEMGLLDGQRRMASAIAKTDIEATLIPRDEFIARIKSMDPVMRNVIFLLIRRLREAAETIMKRKRDAYWID